MLINVLDLRIWSRGLLFCLLPFLATANGRAGIMFNYLATFAWTNGGFPNCELLQAADSNFYGTTSAGGLYTDRNENSLGTVFKISSDGTLTSLYSFDGKDGARPSAGLVQDSDGNFYGTTQYGGSDTNVNNFAYIGDGTIFKFGTNGTLTRMFSFDVTTPGITNGAYPNPLVRGSDGNFYGTTFSQGAGDGTVFKITPQGAFSTLASFTDASCTNGLYPFGTLVEGGDGYFYGVASSGCGNSGTVFKVSPEGNLSLVAAFFGTNGAQPAAGLTKGLDGCFYGTTRSGGANNWGTVFKLRPDGLIMTLHSFNESEGSMGYAKLLLGSDGKLYGRTAFPETNGPTIFAITTNGIFSILYVFSDESDDTAEGLIQAKDGDMYGAASFAGERSQGGIFRLSVPMQPTIQTPVITNNMLLLGWPAVARQNYQLQYNSSLDSNTWSNLGPALVATNGFICMSDSVGSIVYRFYRVCILP